MIVFRYRTDSISKQQKVASMYHQSFMSYCIAIWSLNVRLDWLLRQCLPGHDKSQGTLDTSVRGYLSTSAFCQQRQQHVIVRLRRSSVSSRAWPFLHIHQFWLKFYRALCGLDKAFGQLFDCLSELQLSNKMTSEIDIRCCSLTWS